MQRAMTVTAIAGLIAACSASKPAPPPSPTPPPVESEPPPSAGACQPAGCSGTVCLEAGTDLATTCEWKEWYACYKDHGVCERGADSKCGWRQSPELSACLQQKGASSSGGCPPSAPTVGQACTNVGTGAGAFCPYPNPRGERVCHCEAARWNCYDKPKAEPPSAPN